jgi:hypothetical protein
VICELRSAGTRKWKELEFETMNVDHCSYGSHHETWMWSEAMHRAAIDTIANKLEIENMKDREPSWKSKSNDTCNVPFRIGATERRLNSLNNLVRL